MARNKAKQEKKTQEVHRGTKTHLSDLRKPLLINDRPLDAAPRPPPFPCSAHRANERPQLVQLPTYPSCSTRPPHLLVDLLKSSAQCLLLGS